MGYILKALLILYTMVMALGWARVYFRLAELPQAILSILHIIDYDTTKFYARVLTTPRLKIYQSAAVVEILFAAIGITEDNVTLTAFQVLYRSFMVWGVLGVITPSSSAAIGVALLLFGWSSYEMCRYMGYLISLMFPLGRTHTRTQVRWTPFIIIYMAGFVGECICFCHAFLSQERQAWRITLLTLTFDYRWILIAILLVYIKLFPELLKHTLSLRGFVFRRRVEEEAQEQI